MNMQTKKISPAEIQQLCTTLRGDADLNPVRLKTLDALSFIDDPEAIEPLCKALINCGDRAFGNDGYIASSVCSSLATIGAPSVLPLVDLLTNKSWAVRVRAAQTLESLKDDRALDALLVGLEDPYMAMRKSCARNLDYLAWKPKKDRVGALYCIAQNQWDTCVEIGAPALTPLIELLSFNKEDTRRNATLALIRIGSPAVIPLIEKLHDTNRNGLFFEEGPEQSYPNFYSFSFVTQALAKIGDPQAVEPLIDLLLKCNSWREAAIIASALGDLHDSRAIGPLKQIAAREYKYSTAYSSDGLEYEVEQSDNPRADYVTALELVDQALAKLSLQTARV
jgi:HEAT repeat protein